MVSLLSETKEAAVAHNRWIWLQMGVQVNRNTHLELARVGSLLYFPLEFCSTPLVRSRRRSGTGGGSLVARRCLVGGGGLLLSGALFGSRVARSRGEVEGDGDPICCFGPRDGGGGGGGRLRIELCSE